ncbi:MAG: Maf family protein [Salinivenus sp.]
MVFPLHFTCPFVLASASPRRRALLDQLQIEFSVQVSPADETLDGPRSPVSMVRDLATRKATPVSRQNPAALVLAADTVVAHDGDVLEKPTSPSHAHRMLRRLSGTTHEVHTGFALHHADSDRQAAQVCSTAVSFASLSDQEIDAYVETRSPMDKAGGYGIQDHTAPLFVEGLSGDYYTVVGLPLHALYACLKSDFADLIRAPT